MTLQEKILIFRTCLGVVATLNKIASDVLTSDQTRKKTTENLFNLSKPLNDYLNHLYSIQSSTDKPN